MLSSILSKYHPNQIGVKWIPLSQLSEIALYPNIKAQILTYAKNPQSLNFIEEHLIEDSVLK